MRFKKRSWAYYGRNDSYSKSLNAENAEADGRYPKSRAAKELGLSLKAFKTGYYAADYRTHEWHHVGRYATPVTYFDTNELKDNWKFWFGVSKSYKGKKKLEFLQIAARIKSNSNIFKEINKSRNKSRYTREAELRDTYKLNYSFSFPKHLSDKEIQNKLNELKKNELLKKARARLKEKCFSFKCPESHNTFKNAVKYLNKLGFSQSNNGEFIHPIKNIRIYQKSHTSNYKWKIQEINGQERLGKLIPIVKSLLT